MFFEMGTGFDVPLADSHEVVNLLWEERLLGDCVAEDYYVFRVFLSDQILIRQVLK